MIGAIFWGILILAQLIKAVGVCISMTGEAGAVTAIPIMLCSACTGCIGSLCLAGLTIWGSMLRWSDAGSECSMDLLADSGMAMFWGLIINYVIVFLPLLCCICMCSCVVCCAGVLGAAASSGE